MTVRRLLGCLGDAAGPDKLVAEDAGESLGSDKDQEACAPFRKAKERGAGRRLGGGMPKKSRDKVEGDGQTLNGFNCRAGLIVGVHV